MIWLILYIVVASVLIFCFYYAEEWISNNFYGCVSEPARAVICAVLWPVCGLPYATFMAARYFTSTPIPPDKKGRAGRW